MSCCDIVGVCLPTPSGEQWTPKQGKRSLSSACFPTLFVAPPLSTQFPVPTPPFLRREGEEPPRPRRSFETGKAFDSPQITQHGRKKIVRCFLTLCPGERVLLYPLPHVCLGISDTPWAGGWEANPPHPWRRLIPPPVFSGTSILKLK